MRAGEKLLSVGYLLFNHLSNDSQPRAIQDPNLLALDVDQPGCC
jgi:hypothetical protein